MTGRQLSDQERLDWYRLANSENVGAVTFQQLLQQFGSASAALEALPDLSARGGLRRALKICGRDKAEAEIAKASAAGARYVTLDESDYPALLREAPAPPPLLCIKGDAPMANRPCLAIVGARNASAVGLSFTRRIASELAEAGFVIVSGLARGIDAAAHQASLKTGTIAVVAGGIDHFYPPEHEKLQRAIGESGLLVSEMPCATVPREKSFPRRNRIIAGMALGTIVVEAALRSGSLTTARFANEAGRDVFAVPGSPLDPRCEGTNGLIKDGAHMLTRATEVQEIIPATLQPKWSAAPEPARPLTTIAPAGLRGRVLELLSPNPVDLDILLGEAGAGAGEVLPVLLELELAGLILRHAGGKFSLNA